ncbi:S9 family peptidase [Alteromonas sp. C1M14]|uniref:S9 family peptidase n=1 Tax=Alteromonas sp. C1M14 TaxID=2841567 RepID=UPI001C08B91F|nr:S9 family peptidase [Alteromonas sp. C1M14]MBU2979884.1 S9 family peptidase [Alteromonas sp. C1M14]
MKKCFGTGMLCLVGLLVSTVTSAQTKPAFQDSDVFNLEWAANPAISPDGKTVVFNRGYMDVMTDSRQSRLWMVSSDGSDLSKLTERDTGEGAAVWSPDGKRLAYTSKGLHGSEIYVYWVETGKTARLTELERSPSGLSWSPDGKAIAFSMLVPEKPPVMVSMPAKPKGAKWADAPRITTRLKYEQDGRGYMETGFYHLFVIPAEGGTPRQITSGNFHHKGTPQWTPDGKNLIFSANRHADFEHDFRNSEIYQVNLDSGDIKALTQRKGPDHTPAISPDGKQIAWLGFDDKIQAYQVTRLYVMDIDGSNKHEIDTELDRSMGQLTWQPSGLYFTYDSEGDTRLAKVSLSGKITDLATNMGGTAVSRPYGGGSFSVNAKGQIAFTHTTAYRPSDVAVITKKGNDPALITGLNEDLLAYRTLGKVETVWYKSTADGRKVQGWVVFPPNYEAGKSYPLLVENHGGPISNYGARFSPEIQLYASAGYVVFYPNPRGSTSYGEEFANLLYRNYPGEDYQDVMDGVDEMIRLGYTTEDKLYVTGGSAGGIMTAWMIGKNNRFEAAAVVKPVMNWISKTLTADNYYGYANYRYEGQPWENVQEYWKFSPLSLVGNIHTPTLVMVGDADMRTPLSESKQLYNALKIRKVDTALVEMPGAFHFIAKRPSQLIAKVKHVLAWFERYPSGSASTETQ